MWCFSCKQKITSYQTSIQHNHTTLHWIHLKCSHISPSFKCHTHQKLFHTPNPTPIISLSPTHHQTKKITQNQPIPLHTLPKSSLNNINILKLSINSIPKKYNRTHPFNIQTKNTHHYAPKRRSSINLLQQQYHLPTNPLLPHKPNPNRHLNISQPYLGTLKALNSNHLLIFITFKNKYEIQL